MRGRARAGERGRKENVSESVCECLIQVLFKAKSTTATMMARRCSSSSHSKSSHAQISHALFLRHAPAYPGDLYFPALYFLPLARACVYVCACACVCVHARKKESMAEREGGRGAGVQPACACANDAGSSRTLEFNFLFHSSRV